MRECSCDRWEAAFKTLKDYLHTKGNYIWKESMPMVYKALLARSIEHEVNTPAHKRDNDRSSVAIAVAAAFKDGSSDFSIGRDGSDWLFAMTDVRDLGFIVAWLKWLVDYITHLGRDGYANCFTNHLGSVGTDGACAVTLHCTEEATRGARLYSTATADEWRMEKAQRIETARLLRKAGTDYPFPGWRSIDDMLVHVDKVTHAATDKDGAAAILELLEACGLTREARSRHGAATRTKRTAEDHVPRLLAEYRAVSPLSRS